MAPQTIVDLVNAFERNLECYRSPQYKEAAVRAEFINPFFEALGWDVHNARKYAENYKDVIHEPSLEEETGGRAPDYSFQPAGRLKFYVEAKKPSINIDRDPAPSHQLRMYAWTKQLPLSILTNFAQFAVYDCRVEPRSFDKPTVARSFYLTFREYLERWDELASIFSPEAIFTGSFDRFTETRRRRGAAPFDRRFLDDMEGWRKRLAENIALRNSRLSQRDLNYAVQQTIDRIIFLRICEARGIEPFGRLRDLSKLPDIYINLVTYFRAADDAYNSGLFHFRREHGREFPDELTPRLHIDDGILKHVIKQLYWPERPYAFEVVPADILGQIYERFLGKVIYLTGGHHAKVDDKPEVKKAGGVYYTPTYIVEYIVNSTLGTSLHRSNWRKAANVRVLDPACGSGSFLLGAYEYLLNWYRDQYVKDGPDKHKRRLYYTPAGFKLTIEEKKRILLRHIFGVDIDPQAVEVTKLSLLLKVLEGESEQTVKPRLIKEPALPDLDANIKCGNSLIEHDYDAQLSLLEEESRARVNPFDWNDEFSQAMQNHGFDAVIGNPPWLMAGYYLPDQIKYLTRKFKTAQGKFDLYYTFIEQGCDLTRPSGVFGMIVPNKFFHTRAATSLRGFLAGSKWLRQIVDFGDYQVFDGPTNYSSIIIAEKKPGEQMEYIAAKKGLGAAEGPLSISLDTLSSDAWNFENSNIRELFARVLTLGAPLESLVERFGTGCQSGADRILTFDSSIKPPIEPALLRPLLRGRDVRRYAVAPSPKRVLFPYRVENGEFAILSEHDLQKYRKTFKFLTANRAKLAKRVWFGKNAEELSGKWYGMMYLDSYESFHTPHILTPALSNTGNFAIGTGDLFATGTAGVTSVVPLPGLPESIFYLLGLLNSKLLSTFVVTHSPVFSGGYYKFSAPYLRKLPIRRINIENSIDRKIHDEIVAAARLMISLHTKLAETRYAARI